MASSSSPDQELGPGHQAQPGADQPRRAPLADQDLVQGQQHQRHQEGQRHVQVVRLDPHGRREAVDQPAHRRRQVPGGEAPDGQVRAPGREPVGQHQQEVEAQHRAPGGGDRGQHQPGQRQRRVPHQVHAVRVVEVVGDQQVVPVLEGERHPAQEPHEDRRVAVPALEGPGRRRRPRRGEHPYGQAEEHQQEHRLGAGPQPPAQPAQPLPAGLPALLHRCHDLGLGRGRDGLLGRRPDG